MTTVKLPFNSLPDESWMNQGKCRGMNPDIFFPNNGHNLLTREAIETCNQCPVQLTCLEYALDHNVDHGVWGGTSERERRRIRKARREAARSLRLALDPEPPSHSPHG